MKKLIKNLMFLVLLISICNIFAGCSTGPIVYDKSVPLEQSSTLKLLNVGVDSFNEKNFVWVWGDPNMPRPMMDKHVHFVIIPSGTHTLALRQSWHIGDVITSYTVTMTHDFLPGLTYVVTMDPFTAGGIGIIMEEQKFLHTYESDLQKMQRLLKNRK